MRVPIRPRGHQDGIVEVAVERLYREMRANEEAALWEAVREDSEFVAEVAALRREFADIETRPG